jgi:replication factor A1
MAPADQVFFPIAELSAYHNKWTIKARVTNKAPVRTFNRSSGQGKVFSVDLLDAQGGEIKASFFDQACDQYNDVLEKGKCFTFSRGRAKVANKQYNNTNHKYELTFEKDALIERAEEDSKIETVKYSFTNLRALQTRNLPCTVDICGIITNFRPTATVTSKDGQELVKREITVADDTATSITVALWAERAKQEDRLFEGNPTVALKSIAIREWNNSRSGSLLQSGVLVFKPSFPEAERVQQWWSQGGSSQELVQLSSQPGAGGGDSRARNATPTTLSGLRLATERLGFQPELYSVVSRLALVQLRKQGEVQPLHYMACQEPKEGNGFPCNRRVDEQGFCAPCNRAGKVAPRLNLRCRFVDFEDQAWLGSFHEGATKILGMSGEEVRALEQNAAEKGEGGREELEALIRKRYFAHPMNLIIRAKLDTYNGETRPATSIIDARPVSRPDHGRQMLKEIRELLEKQ